MKSARFRLGLVLALTLVLDLTVLNEMQISDVRPEALLLAAVMAGLVAGPERGAAAGFAAGLLADLFAASPFGLSALVYCLVGFGVGSLQSGILRSAWWIPIATAVTASAAGIVLFGLIGAMVGRSEFLSLRLPLVALVVGLLNGALAPVGVRVLSWSYRPAETRSYGI